MKRAFLVYGPESAGNRLLTRILVACGCYGDGDHHQRLNDGPPPPNTDLVVLFRSVPYARGWPDLIENIDQVIRYGYRPTVLVLNRDVYAMAASQVRTGHAQDIEAAYRCIAAAYKIIFAAISYHKADYLMISYECLFIRQTDYMTWLLKYLGLELLQPVERITDQNEKHYQGGPFANP